LLIEEQRTQLLTYSEQFDNAAWGKAGATVTANAAVSPDGSVTADKIVENTVNTSHRVFQSMSLIAGTYTYSIFAKAGERSNLACNRTTTSIVSFGHYFDLLTGIATGTGGAAMYPVGNGWYRCVGVITVSTDTTGGVFFNTSTGGTTVSYTGDGTSGIYIWGAQLEQAAFATSYIPTVASQVTRAADNASMIGNNFARWYNVNEGTVYSQGQVIGQPSGTNYHFLTIDDGTNSNYITQRVQNNTLRCQFVGVVGGATQWAVSETTPLTVGAFAKAATAYAANDIALTVNGLTPLTDNDALIPVVNRLLIATGISQAQPLNGCISRIAYFNRRLTDSELQGISS
jgi:hypothetical protein